MITPFTQQIPSKNMRQPHFYELPIADRRTSERRSEGTAKEERAVYSFRFVFCLFCLSMA